MFKAYEPHSRAVFSSHMFEPHSRAEPYVRATRPVPYSRAIRSSHCDTPRAVFYSHTFEPHVPCHILEPYVRASVTRPVPYSIAIHSSHMSRAIFSSQHFNSVFECINLHLNIAKCCYILLYVLVLVLGIYLF